MSLVNQSIGTADRIQPDRRPAKVRTVHRVVVELRENQYGDRDVHIEESGAPVHELVGLLELAKDALLRKHPGKR